MKEKLLHEIYAKILEKNSVENPDSIPHSDSFSREIESIMGITREEIKGILNTLHESHYIMIIEIVKEDSDHDIKRVEGYVCAELPVIRTLKNYFHIQLQIEYEKQFRNRLMAHQIIKQLFPSIRQYNNSPLGHILNKSLMLVEFENLIEKEFNEYTPEWKKKKLQELLILQEEENEEKATVPEKVSGQGPDVRRAVDSGSFNGYTEDKARYSSKKLLQIYGFDFFIRVNLRRNNFGLIRDVVDKGYIVKKTELRRLKEMIRKVRDNADTNPELQGQKDLITSLERSVNRAIARSIY